MKIGIVDVGGGFRGVYACGALDDTCDISTLSRNPADMKRLYEKGYADGQKVKEFVYAQTRHHC